VTVVKFITSSDLGPYVRTLPGKIKTYTIVVIHET